MCDTAESKKVKKEVVCVYIYIERRERESVCT